MANVTPRRGRSVIGTVETMAVRLGVLDVVLKAVRGKPYIKRLLSCPVHKGLLGRTAGWAFSPSMSRPDGLIELHAGLFDTYLHELLPVFLHELGHVIDSYDRGKSDHGKSWKSIMARLGAPNETRCHSMKELRYYGKTKMACQTCGRVTTTTNPKPRECTWCYSGHIEPVKKTSIVISLDKSLLRKV